MPKGGGYCQPEVNVEYSRRCPALDAAQAVFPSVMDGSDEKDPVEGFFLHVTPLEGSVYAVGRLNNGCKTHQIDGVCEV